jgi:hypothetical protein
VARKANATVDPKIGQKPKATDSIRVFVWPKITCTVSVRPAQTDAAAAFSVRQQTEGMGSGA